MMMMMMVMETTPQPSLLTEMRSIQLGYYFYQAATCSMDELCEVKFSFKQRDFSETGKKRNTCKMWAGVGKQ